MHHWAVLPAAAGSSCAAAAAAISSSKRVRCAASALPRCCSASQAGCDEKLA